MSRKCCYQSWGMDEMFCFVGFIIVWSIKQLSQIHSGGPKLTVTSHCSNMKNYRKLCVCVSSPVRRKKFTFSLSCRKLPSALYRRTWLWLQGIRFLQGDPSVYMSGRFVLFWGWVIFPQWTVVILLQWCVLFFRVEILFITLEVVISLSMERIFPMRTSSWSTLDQVIIPLCTLLQVKMKTMQCYLLVFRNFQLYSASHFVRFKFNLGHLCAFLTQILESISIYKKCP